MYCLKNIRYAEKTLWLYFRRKICVNKFSEKNC
jgi:hypothetical protein